MKFARNVNRADTYWLPRTTATQQQKQQNQLAIRIQNLGYHPCQRTARPKKRNGKNLTRGRENIQQEGRREGGREGGSETTTTATKLTKHGGDKRRRHKDGDKTQTRKRHQGPRPHTQTSTDEPPSPTCKTIQYNTPLTPTHPPSQRDPVPPATNSIIAAGQQRTTNGESALPKPLVRRERRVHTYTRAEVSAREMKRQIKKPLHASSELLIYSIFCFFFYMTHPTPVRYKNDLKRSSKKHPNVVR